MWRKQNTFLSNVIPQSFLIINAVKHWYFSANEPALNSSFKGAMIHSEIRFC